MILEQLILLKTDQALLIALIFVSREQNEISSLDHL